MLYLYLKLSTDDVELLCMSEDSNILDAKMKEYIEKGEDPSNLCITNFMVDREQIMGVSIYIKTDLDSGNQSITINKTSDEIKVTPGVNIIDIKTINKLEDMLNTILSFELYNKYNSGDSITITNNDNLWDILITGLVFSDIMLLINKKPKLLIKRNLLC